MNPLPTPEATRRNEIPVHSIVLADGQAWGFARPSTRLKPRIVAELDRTGRPVGSVAVHVVVEYPLEIRRRLDAIGSAMAGSDADRIEALFNLAALLLRRAHDIDPVTAAVLLDLGENLPRFASELLGIAMGQPGCSPRSLERVINV